MFGATSELASVMEFGFKRSLVYAGTSVLVEDNFEAGVGVFWSRDVVVLIFRLEVVVTGLTLDATVGHTVVLVDCCTRAVVKSGVRRRRRPLLNGCALCWRPAC